MLGADQNGATKITVKKADLLAKVVANRAKHVEDVKLAWQKFRDAVAAEAQALLDAVDGPNKSITMRSAGR